MREKGYIENLTRKNMISKRGQVAIFVILALVIGSVIVLFAFKDQVNSGIGTIFGSEFTPRGFLAECIGDDLDLEIERLGKNAGYDSLDSVGKVSYQGDEYAYLCYTTGSYLTCVVQQPLIKGNFEKSLKGIIEPKAEECLEKLKEEYRRKGFEVRADESIAEVSMNPGNVKIIFDTPITASKGEEVQRFDKLEIELKSDMYDLTFMAKSIIDFESTFGDSETTLYMQYYPDLKIDKIKLSDGTTIYKVSNVVSGEEFRFASRSLAWPEGGYL
jgi:hypothetical protein